ncbi:MAG: hypothetical protein ABIP30_03485, partial [Ferruginibacter sp.]
ISMHFTAGAYQLMSTNFYIVDANGPTLMDGNITIYDNQYSNGVDWNDGTKMNNYGENWGLIRNGVSLVVERRQLVAGPDTAFFNMWGMQLRNYRFEVTMENFDSTTIAAYVWDEYLHAITPVHFSGITTVNFTVDNNAASKQARRFKLIYTTPSNYATVYATTYGLLPVTITGINAIRVSNGAQVNWTVETENSMNNYQVEGSEDGTNFKTLATVNALNTAGRHSYSYIDNTATKEISYYRIKAITKYGNPTFTSIAKIGALSTTTAAEVNVFPNPVTNRTVQLRWDNASIGIWETSLVYPDGRMQPLKSQIITSSRVQTTVALPVNLPAGVYSLYLKNAEGKAIVKTIIVL